MNRRENMTVSLKGRHFLTLMDFTTEEIRYLLDLGHELKARKKAGIYGESLKHKNIALIFEKTSTRTRCSFEVACKEEGANVVFIDPSSSHFGKKESLEDSAKVLGKFFDGIEYRGFGQEIVEGLAEHSGAIVWNGLTNEDHPTQILADLLTIEENINKPLKDIKVVFCGDIRNNMSYAWMYGCAKMGMHYVAYGPESMKPQLDDARLKKVEEVAEVTGATIEISSAAECLKGADVIYTDVWASMGEESEIPARSKLLMPYKVTMDMLKATGNDDVVFMHCLPAFHDFETKLAKEQKESGIDIREVTDEVFRSRNSKVFEEAENRIYSIKAVVVATLGEQKGL